MAATFKTNPVGLEELLKQCQSGDLQLPDFQRSWVWDDERIRGLIASISQAFPVGALMTLETGGDVDFKPRRVEGTPENADRRKPSALLLDGQQRMTSLYQTTLRNQVVETVTSRQVKVKRWYYISIRAAMELGAVRQDAIIGVPEDRRIQANFKVKLDLSSPEREYAELMFPVTCVFDWDAWQDGFRAYWDKRDPETAGLFKPFKDSVLRNFTTFQVPVITLAQDTSKEAVCLVFEKVNTGGKALDAFELVTAMYAADDFELRKDCAARQAAMAGQKVLRNLASTDFLQAVALLHTKALRQEAADAGKELPAISANRNALLRVPLPAYQAYAPRVQAGFLKAAKLLHGLGIYRAEDVPYPTQLTPLAAILAELPDAQWESAVTRAKLAQWFWNGVFGELYGSAVESRFARDVVEVPAWLADDALLPSTVQQATVRADRLRTMRSRLSAAYKGVHALLMRAGARDFRSGQAFDAAVFFDENVDIHHIFPKAWCETAKVPPGIADSIINKTPLSARTNRIIGGVAPSTYLARLQAGGATAPKLPAATLDQHLQSHLIDPALLRVDSFDAFVAAREKALLRLIEAATGRPAFRGEADEPELEPTADEMHPLMAAE